MHRHGGVVAEVHLFAVSSWSQPSISTASHDHTPFLRSGQGFEGQPSPSQPAHVVPTHGPSRWQVVLLPSLCKLPLRTLTKTDFSMKNVYVQPKIDCFSLIWLIVHNNWRKQ